MRHPGWALAEIDAEFPLDLTSHASLEAQVAAERAGEAAKEYGLKNIDVHVKGPGPGRDPLSRHRRHRSLDRPRCAV